MNRTKQLSIKWTNTKTYTPDPSKLVERERCRKRVYFEDNPDSNRSQCSRYHDALIFILLTNNRFFFALDEDFADFVRTTNLKWSTRRALIYNCVLC